MRFSVVAAAKNLFEVAATLPNYGVGHRVARTTWPADTCFWTLTKVKPSVTASGRGDAWGVLTWNGETATAGDAARVNGALKKVWRCTDGGGAAAWKGEGGVK